MKVTIHVKTDSGNSLYPGTTAEWTSAKVTLNGKELNALADEVGDIELVMGKAYTLAFSGEYTGTVDNGIPNSLPSITCRIETCHVVNLDGVIVKRLLGENVRVMTSKSDLGWYPKSTYILKIAKPDSSEDNDLGSSTSGSNKSSESSCCGGSGGGGAGPPTSSEAVKVPEATFQFGAGREGSGKSLGHLFLIKPLDSAGTLSRQDFDVNSLDSTIETPIADGGGLRQIRVHEGLIDIVDDSGGIVLKFYSNSNVGSKDGGLYTTTGAAFVKHRLEVGMNTVAGSGILHSTTRNGATSTEGFYGSGNTVGSIMRTVHLDGRISETMNVLDVDPLDDSIWTRTVESRELVVDNSVEVETSYIRREYASRPWGEVLERTISDPSGANLITEYAYYEDEINDGAAYRKLKYVIQPDSSWTKRAYGSTGGLIKTYRPWKDLPAHPDDATDSNCQYTEIVSASSTRNFILGVQTSRSQTMYNWGSEFDGEQSWDFNIVENWRYHGGGFAGLSTSSAYVYLTQFYRSVAADGTATRYVETKGNFNESTGVFTESSGGAYTRSVSTQGTVTDAPGIANKTRRTITISDAKGPRRKEEQVYTGADYERVSATTYEYETGLSRRLLSVSQDGDVTSSIVYTSATETAETDAYGVTTNNTYDASGELLSAVKVGIGAGVDYQAQADITTSHANDVLTSTTTITAGGLTLTSSQTSDKVGRMVSQTDEQGRVTTYAFTSGGRVTTETGPGGVTRITTNYLDGQLKSVTGTGVIPEFHDYTLDGSANVVHTVYYGTGDNVTARWRKTVTNGLGQLLEESSPGPNGNPIVTQHTYNVLGQRIKTVRTGYADTIYVYDDLGGLIRQGQDLNNNGSLDLVSADPVSEVDTYFEKDVNNDWWQVSINRRYLKDDDNGDVAVSLSRQKLGAGVESVVESVSHTGVTAVGTTGVDRANKSTVTSVSSSTSNLSAVTTRVNGLVVKNSTFTVSKPVLYRYDSLGRQIEMLDPRTDIAIVNVYDSVGQVTSVTNGEGDVTTYAYYGSAHANAGMLASQTNDEGEVIRYAYDHLGRLTHQWGGGSSPLAYSYNLTGEMVQLKTYRASGDWTSSSLPSSFLSASPAVTAWTYHAASGLLSSKTDAASKAVSYSYYDSGLLASRTWARGVVTSYGYDNAGRMNSVDYSDATPDVTYSYRRDGQVVNTTDGQAQAGGGVNGHEFSYQADTGLQVFDNLFNDQRISRTYDGQGRLTQFRADYNADLFMTVNYTYDPSSRLATVSEGDQVAEYGYVPNSDLLQSVTLKNSGTTRLTGTRSYDDVGRIGSITWVNAATQTVSSHAYTHDGAGRRLRATLADGAYWAYTYNDKGEVVAAVKKDALDAVYPGLSLGYTFDEIGNRLTASVDAEGGGNRTQSYAGNELNQYTGISHPSTFDVTGSALSAAIVKVNTLSAQRQGEYFRKQLPTANSTQPVWEPVELEVRLPGAGVGGGDIVTQRQGNYYVPSAVETLSYDLDGNLLGDGRWNYTWDGENRLVSMETTNVAEVAGAPKKRIRYVYDGSHRRYLKAEDSWNGSGWVELAYVYFIYDGWNLIAEIKHRSGEAGTREFYVWGMDVSQADQGAGGVGGLLWRNHVTGDYPVFSTQYSHYATYDGNGNTTALVNAAGGQDEARYEYDAFGRITLIEGRAVAYENPIRYSTKYQDHETDLLYYGHRYYDVVRGRWTSRDPLGESGSLNLNAMCRNDLLNRYDLLGLFEGPRTIDPGTAGRAVASRTAVASRALPAVAGVACADGPLPFADALVLGSAYGLTVYYLAIQVTEPLIYSAIPDPKGLPSAPSPQPKITRVPTKPGNLPKVKDEKWDRCNERYKLYKKLEKDFVQGARQTNKLLDDANNRRLTDFDPLCRMLADQLSKLEKALDGRDAYKNDNCDEFDWYNEGSSEAERAAKHQTAIDGLTKAVNNLKKSLERFCN
ncbi:RHS repeat-associated core domain-containing protein [Verrucomicrobium sp. BvORR034]|uniref:RHS repeat-associated core domain-containing protein n=1 Tax=Verrucomicrobium sp. BvORR034 TaxID=1396418 RepID=UPI0022410297|nr:RHS repeat-associated core domain-containing protein [Verrucomicrobium sp. BvORR034]